MPLDPRGLGGLAPPRIDQRRRPPLNTIAPSSAGITRARQVVILGPGDGEFVYNSTGTRLLSSNVGAVTKDPILGITVPQGFATFNSSGKVINLESTQNNAFFVYADSGAAQGQMIIAVSSANGVDPVAGFNYFAGLYGLDPVGGSIQVLGPVINLSEIAFTRAAVIKPVVAGSAALRPYIQLDAPEQTTASHLQMIMQGASPDGTKPGQLLLGAVAGAGTLTAQTGSTIEAQSTGAATSALSGTQPSVPAGSLGLDIRVVGDTAARATLTAGFNSAGAGVSAGDGAHGHDVIMIRAAAGQWVASLLTAIQPGTTNTPETFHAFAGANSWAQSAGAPVWGYQMQNSNEVEVSGAVVVPAGFAANQAIAAALGTQYRPANAAPSLTAFDVGPAGNTKDIVCRFYMTTGGVLTTSPAFPAGVAAGDIISFPTQKYRLT